MFCDLSVSAVAVAKRTGFNQSTPQGLHVLKNVHYKNHAPVVPLGALAETVRVAPCERLRPARADTESALPQIRFISGSFITHSTNVCIHQS